MLLTSFGVSIKVLIERGIEMETVKATFTKGMDHEWFMEMLQMLAKCNMGRLIEVTGTGLKLNAATGTDKITYRFTGTFGTLMEVSRNEWLAELFAHENEVCGIVDSNPNNGTPYKS